MAAADQREGRHRERLRRRTDQCDVAVACQQLEIRTNVMLSRDGVENEIETAGVLLHLVRIARDDNFISTETLCVLFLVRRSGEHDDVRAECVRNLYAHVAQPTDTNNSHFLAWSNSPVTHG